MSKLLQFIGLRKNPVVKSIGVYTFTNFFSKAVSFLLLFIYTDPAYITPSENGLLSLMSTAIIFVMPFVSMGVLYSISTDYFKLGKKDFRDLFTTSFLLPLAITLICFLSLYIFRQQLKTIYGFPYSFVWIIPAIAFFTFCNEHLINLVRNKNESNRFLFINLGKTFIELSISIVLVFFFAWRWKGRVAGILIAYIFTVIYAFYYFYKRGYLFGEIKKKYIYNELVYAVPIIAMQASIFCMSVSDKFFLSYYTSDNNATVGIYSIAATFASIIIVLSTALLQYIFPKVYTYLSSAQIDYQGIRKYFKMYVMVMLFGLFGIFIFAPVAYHFFINERYHTGLKYVFLLCTGYFLWSLTYFFYSFLLYNKQKRKIFSLSVCSIICSLCVNFFFISNLGPWGAAIANICTYSFVLLITLFFTKDHWKHFLKRKYPNADPETHTA